MVEYLHIKEISVIFAGKYPIMAKYIDPFTDTGFKIIFGKEHVSNDILRSFLNVLFEGDPVLSDIRSVEYRPTEKTREWTQGNGPIPMWFK